MFFVIFMEAGGEGGFGGPGLQELMFYFVSSNFMVIL